uniref:Major facilitator superfamily (MFS) profile domain-containing protein n=2 Tax=Trichobilharzia regenti TaxID=157069 RepID=A0AA85IZT1_TRIRE|nr:unnamed protein product [Trichobilharzia regenti]
MSYWRQYHCRMFFCLWCISDTSHLRISVFINKHGAIYNGIFKNLQRANDFDTDFRMVFRNIFALFGLCMPVGGVLSCRIGYRPVVAVSCFLLSGGVLLTYFTIQKVYVGVLMTYSFLFGTGVGLGFSVTLAVAATWFPEQRGLVVGLVVSGYGMGSLVFGPIQTALINPHNVRVNNVTRQFDNKEMLDRLPDAFLILGGILLATQIIGFIFLRPKPKIEAVEDTKETASEKSSAKYETEDDEVQIYGCYPDSLDVTPAQLFRHIDFYLLWFIELCNSVMLTVVTSAYKLFGQTFISDDQYLTAAVTVAAVFNALGRILWGSAVDRFSYKIPLLIISLTWAILLLSFPFISTASEFTAKALFCFYGIGNFLFLSSISTIAPATVGSMFGCKHMAVNYGILASARTIGCPLCAFVLTYIITKDPYLLQFTVCGCSSLIAFFLTLWIDDHKIPQRLNCCSPCSRTCQTLRIQRS